jgi:hypothetical protein
MTKFIMHQLTQVTNNDITKYLNLNKFIWENYVVINLNDLF